MSRLGADTWAAHAAGITHQHTFIWEHDGQESMVCFRAFAHFRDDPNPDERNIDRAWRLHKGFDLGDIKRRAPGVWWHWALTHRWRERAEAYDRYIDKVKRRARENRYRQLEERRADFEYKLQEEVERRHSRVGITLEKHENAPATTVYRRIETMENGQPKTEITKIDGMDMNGYAKTNEVWMGLGTMAVRGPEKFKNSSEDSERVLPKAVMPEWLAESLTVVREPLAIEAGGSTDSKQ